MAKTESNMIPLGSKAPNFHLTDVTTDKKVTLQDLASPVATVIAFLSNHCPYVIHIQDKMVEIAKKYLIENIHFIGICSNDAQSYPDDSPENMKQQAKTHQFPFPYLYDESQQTAKNYQAACTPDFYIFDKNLACVYRGRMDASTPGNGIPVTGSDLSDALQAIVDGKAINPDQKSSMGCGIKWKNSQ